jgi:hypothetical protein
LDHDDVGRKGGTSFDETKKSPAPRKVLYDAYRDFVDAYRRGAERLRAGDRDAPFPLGCVPPALPFTGG